MRTFRLIAAELFGLFVDDARLAVSVVVLLVGLGVMTRLLPDQPVATVVVLTIGCVAILVDATMRAARS